jgi:hypothetical protein
MEDTYAYLAGVIDIKGSIAIARRGRAYYSRIGITDDSPIIPDLASAMLGGRTSHTSPQRSTYGSVFIWEATYQAAREPILRVRPYLRLKQRQADIALELIELVRRQEGPISTDSLATRVRLYEEMNHLNRGRRQRRQRG